MKRHTTVAQECINALCEAEKSGIFDNGIAEVVRWIKEASKFGKMVAIFGNGGSAADAQHWAAELVCTYEIKKRCPISALALTTDSSVLTAWSNDSSFSDVFARQVCAHAAYTYLAIGLSTSGRSLNVISGLQAARQYGIKTVLISGDSVLSGGGKEYSCHIRIPSSSTPVIQTVTQVLYHQICHELDADALSANEE
jgi:D-sedoheptulose 7-phosphate isomerase